MFLVVLKFCFERLPLVGAQIELVKGVIVWEHVFLAAKQDKVWCVWADGVISERRWVLLFGRSDFYLSPFRRQVIELGFDKIIENTFFLVVAAMNENFSCLNAWGKVRTRGDFTIEPEFDPSGIDLFVLKGFGDIDFEAASLVVIVLRGKDVQWGIFKLLHE